jgi:hypothetical protein
MRTRRSVACRFSKEKHLSRTLLNAEITSSYFTVFSVVTKVPGDMTVWHFLNASVALWLLPCLAEVKYMLPS